MGRPAWPLVSVIWQDRPRASVWSSRSRSIRLGWTSFLPLLERFALKKQEVETHEVLSRLCFFGRGFNSRRLHQPFASRKVSRRSFSEGGLHGFKLHDIRYVYLLQSRSHPSHRHTVLTNDLEKRLANHNEGGVPHTPQEPRDIPPISGSSLAVANRHLAPTSTPQADASK